MVILEKCFRLLPRSQAESKRHYMQEVGGEPQKRKAAATAKIDTAELSFMCSIFLLMFLIGFLPKQTCLTRSIVIIEPKLTRCSFLFSEQHCAQNG